VAALTDSDKPRDYWYRMKKKEAQSGGVELSTFCRQLKKDGELRKNSVGAKYAHAAKGVSGQLRKRCEELKRQLSGISGQLPFRWHAV